MPEVAVNVPFESSEIIEIVVQELRSRLKGLSPLYEGKEYAGFSLDFQVKAILRRAGESKAEARETLAWGRAERIDKTFLLGEEESIDHHSTMESKDPNEERVDREMPLTVETGDGKGGKIRKKVKIK